MPDRPTTSPTSPCGTSLPVLVDQADVVPRRGPADGVELVGEFVREQQAGAAALGHAVDIDQPARPARQHIGLERGREGRAGAGLDPEARQIEAVEIGQRHDPAILHGHQHRVGGALGLGEFAEAAARRSCSISTTRPPPASAGRKLTSVVFE